MIGYSVNYIQHILSKGMDFYLPELEFIIF